MQTKTKFLLGITSVMALFVVTALSVNKTSERQSLAEVEIKNEKGCVFMTTFGEQSSEGYAKFKLKKNIQPVVNDGLSWLAKAQLGNGGYGAGSHNNQGEMNPHAVSADPATTSMVAMALLRSGSTLKKGEYKEQLQKALNFLLEQVESVSKDDAFITKEKGTQIQTKLGQNIDAVLTAQFFSNILKEKLDKPTKKRVEKCLDICVDKIQRATGNDGRVQGAGWAGVLQSGLATSALESAQSVGAELNEVVVTAQKQYLKDNYDEDSKSVKTTDGAGIILYSVSNSARGSAKDARKARELIEKAKKEGKLEAKDKITVESFKKLGISESDAIGYTSSYNVYNASKVQAQRDDVMSGFGNNGGEEFLSFLQTGESMVVNDDNDWKTWYDDVSGRLIKIQNEDGSWNGHHCITSPVFCTATSLLILSIENDIENLKQTGED
ncbi:hypothetical protein [Winogradskyella flava]|uniref:Squalene cyclase C-terminal domain-containing protein n=1 Tax=Winogradskyella flava TaxID=1884876 RepID=A0A842IUM2_9FLAO|nr:hypothetical protein [Winogradskyella flava]MBC2846485.1 hypothetical protein [Winogradskyella flava]